MRHLEWILRRWEPLGAVGGELSPTLVRDRLDPGVTRVLKRARSGAERQALERERDILLGLHHPSIRRVHAAASSPDEAVLLLEHVDGIDVARHLSHDPGNVRRCTVEILRALVHLHQAGRAHGDLKPANILVDTDGSVHLIDLGLTGHAGEPVHGGTRAFLPPESEHGAPLSLAGDLYSLARTLASACPREHWPAPVATLLERCLHERSEERPSTATDALAMLGESPRPLDRLGEIPWTGCEELMASARDVLGSSQGATLVVRGPCGAGRSRFVRELAADSIRRDRPLADAGLARGHDPLTPLHRLLLPIPSTSERQLSDVVAGALAAAARDGVAVVLDDADQISDDLRHALGDGVRAISAIARGSFIVMGADHPLGDLLASAGARVVDLPRLGRADVEMLFASIGVRASEPVLNSVVRSSEGRAGVVGRLAQLLLDEPELGPSDLELQVQTWDRSRAPDVRPELSLEQVRDLARQDLALRAGRSAAQRLRRARPDLEEEPSRDPESAVLLARAEAVAGNLAAAVDLLDALGQDAPADARLDLARLLERLGRYRDSCDVALPLVEMEGIGAEAAMVAATASLAAGDIGAAKVLVERGLGRPSLHAVHVQLLLVRSDVALRGGDHGGALSHAEHAEKALSEAGEPDPGLLAKVRSRQASAHALGGSPIRAREGHASALAAAEVSGDVASLPPYVMNLATSEHALGEWASAIAHYEEAARLAGRLGRESMRAAALTNLAGLYVTIGATTEARGVLALARDAAVESGSALYRAQTTLIAAEVAGREDRARGRELARDARRDFLGCGAARQALEAELLEAELFDGPSQREDARAFCASRRGPIDEAGLGGRSALLLARVGLEGGDLAEAREHGEEAVRTARAAGDLDLETRALRCLAETHRRLRTGGDDALLARAREVVAVMASRLPPGLRDRFMADPDRAFRAGAPGPAGERTTSGLGPSGRRLVALVRRVLLEGDERRLLETAVDEAVTLTRAERAFLLRRGPNEPRRNEVVVARNLDGESIRRRRRGSFSRSAAEEVISTGEAMLTAMAPEDPRLHDARSVLDLGLRSILCVPVRGPQGIVGALYLDHRFQAARFGDEDLELVQALADIIGVALENARLHREAAARTRELELAHATVSAENEQRGAELARLSDRLALAGDAPLDVDGPVVGRSPGLRQALELARRVAASDLSILIEGESGTGKELLARYIHDQSLRRKGPFLAINCAAVPETLLESELFGHVRGAFTGAVRDAHGLFRAAGGGTVMLDEIGDMPPRMQPRLLRVLQEREVRPVGGSDSVPVDVRVIAATNKDLEAEVEAGRFRQDLFFRLVGVSIRMPPLRERLEDIPLLARAALSRITREPGMRHVELSREAQAALLRHSWPGNVRELEQSLRRAVLVAEGDRIRSDDLELRTETPSRMAALRSFDRDLVVQALRAAGGNRSAAARALGVSRISIHRWIKRYGLD
jgi:transcriptional regulator with GAF, ATPase, and Fis domain/serine/threonine protein kinase